MKITKDSNLGKLVVKYPETVEVFLKYGLHCIGCMAAHYETLEQAAKGHGLDIKKLLKELNDSLKK